MAVQVHGVQHLGRVDEVEPYPLALPDDDRVRLGFFMSNGVPLMAQLYFIMLPVGLIWCVTSVFADLRRTSSAARSWDAVMIMPVESCGRTDAFGALPEPVRIRARPLAFLPSARATSGKTPSPRVTRTS